MICFPDINSSLKKEKEGKNLLFLLSTLIRGNFSFILCLAVRWSIDAL